MVCKRSGSLGAPGPSASREEQRSRDGSEGNLRQDGVPCDSAYDGAASLRAEFGLRTPDAIHLATALTNECEEFWTNDEKLLRASTGIVFRSFA